MYSMIRRSNILLYHNNLCASRSFQLILICDNAFIMSQVTICILNQFCTGMLNNFSWSLGHVSKRPFNDVHLRWPSAEQSYTIQPFVAFASFSFTGWCGTKCTRLTVRFCGTGCKIPILVCSDKTQVAVLISQTLEISLFLVNLNTPCFHGNVVS